MIVRSYFIEEHKSTPTQEVVLTYSLVLDDDAIPTYKVVSQFRKFSEFIDSS